jgi:hypothetical protein
MESDRQRQVLIIAAAILLLPRMQGLREENETKIDVLREALQTAESLARR